MRRSTDDRRAPTVYSPRAELSRERLRAHDPTESRAAVYRRARHDLEALAGADDAAIDAEAAEYVRRYPDHPPDHFSTSTRKRRDKARRALQPGAWGARLLGSIERPHGYSLHAEHLGLPPEAADPERLYDPVNVRLWLQAIRRHFRGPIFWRLELGEGRIHVHIIAAHDDGPPGLPRGGEIVQPLYDVDGWVRYLSWPPAGYSAVNLARYLKARRRGRLSRLSGIIGVPSRRIWGCEANRSALRVSLCPDHPSAPSAPALKPDLTRPPDRSSDPDTAPPSVICDGAVADRIRSISTARIVTAEGMLELLRSSVRSPDRSKIRSITALEAGCTSVTAHLAPGSIPDPAFTPPPELSAYGCPISAKSAKSTTLVRPVLDGVSSVCGLPWSYPLRRKNRLSARKNPSAPSLTLETRLRVCTLGVLRGRSRQRPGARGPPVCP